MADVDSMMADYYRLPGVAGGPVLNCAGRYRQLWRLRRVEIRAFSLRRIAPDIRINAQPNIGANDIHTYSMPSIATQESPRIRCPRIL
ncbi:hypothetical protein [Burkholderia cepacia]|uniref:hypothetical protein n=1 Tax=Burkholderia cepacia TaxID=292 RepID=UPI0012D96CC8|nr:hypothetical protein [Burkholderia cepacia]